MEIREKWQQTTSWLDELPKTTAGMAGVVVFLCAGLLILRLPTWGFALGLLSLLAVLCWLALSGKPVVKLTWPVSTDAEALMTHSIPDSAPPATRPDEQLEMIELPGGEFWMGSPRNESEREEDEERHRVRVSAFAMGKYLVTQKQYQAVMGENPSFFSSEQPNDTDWEVLPVETVSWFDAVRFCNRLSEASKRRPCYRITASTHAAGTDDLPHVEWDQAADGYRLPTEAEWEYACRVGTETAYSFRDHDALFHEYVWPKRNSPTQVVRQNRLNNWGLHDLQEKLWEWCWDWYANYKVINHSDGSVIVTNPIGPPKGDRRVLRGGSFGSRSGYQRPAFRGCLDPEDRNRVLGFRCVRGAGRQP